MWPEPFEQTFVTASLGVSIWNLNLIGPVVSEKMFEIVDGRTPKWLSLWLMWAKNVRDPDTESVSTLPLRLKGGELYKFKGGQEKKSTFILALNKGHQKSL